MSKFGGEDWILVLQEHKESKGFIDDIVSKRTITTSASQYATSKNVPKARRFSSRKADKSDPFLASFNLLSGNCLQGITSNDKLMVFAHGSDTGLAWMADGGDNAVLGGNALALARLLQKHGLSEVGLITFKACYVGRGEFLHTLAYALSSAGIKAGWLKGYKGLSQTKQSGGDVWETIKSDDKRTLTDANEDRTAAGHVIETDRFKIVRGPGKLHKDTKVGRYDGAQQLSNKGQRAVDIAIGLEAKAREKRFAVEDILDD